MNDQLLSKANDLLKTCNVSGMKLNNLVLVRFVTLNKVCIYGLTDQEQTSILNLTQTLFDNYDCVQAPRSKIKLYVPSLKRSLGDFNHGMKLSELNSGNNKIIDIHLINPNIECYAVPKTGKEFNPEDGPYIIIKTITGKQYPISIVPCDTVRMIKQRIYDTYSIPVYEQRLIFKGRQLEDDRWLSDYEIRKESTLDLVLRLRGGMYAETSGRAGNYGPLEPNMFLIQPNSNHE